MNMRRMSVCVGHVDFSLGKSVLCIMTKKFLQRSVVLTITLFLVAYPCNYHIMSRPAYSNHEFVIS